MLRHLNNLERLCNKLQCRLGAHDALSIEAKTALEAHRAAIRQAIKPSERSIFHASTSNHLSNRLTPLTNA